MTSKEIYKRFLLEMNKNDSNEGANILVSHFVLLFNTERLRWLSEFFNDDSDNWKLTTIDNLLEIDMLLKKVKTYEDSVEFEIPSNFFRQSSSFSIADKDNCKGKKIFNFEKKALGFQTTLADDFSAPQFDYEETPYVITKKKLRVYFKDFTIKKAYLSFYREPKPIDISGYIKIDGSESTDLDTDLTDEQIDSVIERVVKRVSGKIGDIEKHQIANERISTEP